MAHEILAIAFIRPEEGKEEETLGVLHELYSVMARKGYSRNTLYRDIQDSTRLVNVRYWTSEEARQQAHDDPEIHRQWAHLGQVAKVDHVLPNLEEIPAKWTMAAE